MNKWIPHSNVCILIHKKKQTIFAQWIRPWEVCSASAAWLKPRVGIPLLLLLERLLGLLLLQADLLGVRVLQGFHKYGSSGTSLPHDTVGVFHRRLHRNVVRTKDGEVQQKLSTEVIVMRLNPLLHLIGHIVNGDLE